MSDIRKQKDIVLGIPSKITFQRAEQLSIWSFIREITVCFQLKSDGVLYREIFGYFTLVSPEVLQNPIKNKSSM